MDGFLYFAGTIIIIASFFSLLFREYAFILFPIIFALGCIVLGLGKIINLLEMKHKTK